MTLDLNEIADISEKGRSETKFIYKSGFDITIR